MTAQRISAGVLGSSRRKLWGWELAVVSLEDSSAIAFLLQKLTSIVLRLLLLLFGLAMRPVGLVVHYATDLFRPRKLSFSRKDAERGQDAFVSNLKMSNDYAVHFAFCEIIISATAYRLHLFAKTVGHSTVFTDDETVTWLSLKSPIF